MSTDLLISTLDKWFKTIGYPHRIRSDGGPAFRDNWERWAKSKGIEPQITSPYSSSSNGLAENGVKEIKRLWMKCEMDNSDFDEALFIQNNTTRLNGGSPAEIFFRRKLYQGVPNMTLSSCPDFMGM